MKSFIYMFLAYNIIREKNLNQPELIYQIRDPSNKTIVIKLGPGVDPTRGRVLGFMGQPGKIKKN